MNVHLGGSVAISSTESSPQDSNAAEVKNNQNKVNKNQRTLVGSISISVDSEDGGGGTAAKSTYQSRGFGSGE